MIVFPNAKINIGLNIVGDRPDGYHNLETIFYPIPVQEALEILPAPTALPEGYSFSAKGLAVAGKPESNLVVRAYCILRDNGYKMPDVRLILDKIIPMGSGIGGGSADGSFTLKALNEMFSLNIPEEKMIQFAAKLGADCPFFILNRPVYATGIGEIMTPVPLDLSGMHFVLVRPDVFVSTKDAFAGIKSVVPQTHLSELIKLPVEEWQGRIVNDFEGSIFPKFPAIKVVKDTLLEAGAVYASMSGSGSSVFALFRNEPPAGLKESFPGAYYFHAVLPAL